MDEFQLDDLFLHHTISSIAGDKRHDTCVAFVSAIDRVQDSYVTSAWRVGQGKASRIDGVPDDATSQVLSPCGKKLAFLSSKASDNGKQVHVLDLADGKLRQLTHLGSTPTAIEHWSDDGSRLLLTDAAPWSEDARDDGSAKDARPRVVTHLPYKRDGKGPTVGERARAVAIDAGNGKETVLVSGDFDVKSACWSDDGKYLAFVRTTGGTQRHVTQLWLADADGGNPRAAVDSLASVSSVCWSPDSTRIALSGSRREGDSIDTLWVYDVDDGAQTRPAGNGLHLEGGVVIWSSDNQRIALIAARRGLHELVVVDADSGQVTVMSSGLRQLSKLCPSGERLVFAHASLRRPEDIASCRWDGTDRARHTRFNRWMAERVRPRVSRRRFVVPDGEGGQEKIDAWVLLPLAGEGPRPVLVDMHGGPHSAVLFEFPTHVYWYALLARGWAIVAPNAVGSSSYGPEFAHRLVGKWGTLDLPQYLAIVDTLAAEGTIDPLRVTCYGKSYGGFLAAWSVAHSSRFAAAVVSAPVADIESHAGTSDTGFYVSPYAMGGEISLQHKRMHDLSPTTHADKVRTPVLLLQGEDDQRCPLGQAEEFFARLVRCDNTEAKMVVYPKGSHSLAGSGKPSHRADYHGRIVDWCEQWTASAAGGQTAPAEDGATGKHAPSSTHAPTDADVPEPANQMQAAR